MPVVEIEGLTKDYPLGSLTNRKTRALDHLTLSIEQGEVFGLIGPNGAGKTTTLKLLMGLIFPTEGKARILDRPVDDVTMKAEIGYLPENPYFYDYLTGRELLDYFGQLFGMSRGGRRTRTGELLERVGLTAAGDLQLRKYSKGMTQRLGVAQAILNRPRIVFLDEPMSGLDPMGRRDMTVLIQELRDEGVTVLFCSHILPDVEALCDRVAILNQGKTVKEGRLSDILDLSLRTIEVVLESVSDELERQLSDRTQKLHRLGSGVKLELADQEALDEVLGLVRSNGARLVSVHPVKQTLEEYFVREVGAANLESA
jgi:ABC-2 type transport system ATP-binding protein